MFRNKKNLLSKHEIQLLDNARSIFIKGFEVCSANPSDFATILQALQTLEKSVQCLYDALHRHIEAKAKADANPAQPDFHFFRLSLPTNPKKYADIINQAKAYLLQDLDTAIQQCFAK